MWPEAWSRVREPVLKSSFARTILTASLIAGMLLVGPGIGVALIIMGVAMASYFIGRQLGSSVYKSFEAISTTNYIEVLSLEDNCGLVIDTTNTLMSPLFLIDGK